LSAAGKRVVLRDLDAQRSLTKSLRALGTPEDGFGRLTFLRHVALVPDGAPLPFKSDIELIDAPPALADSVPGVLQEIRSLGQRFGVYVFDPIPESKAVMTFSMTGRLWPPVADRIIQVMMEAPPRG